MACTSRPRSAVCSPLRHSSSHEMHTQTAPQKKHCGQRERFQGFLLKPILISSIPASYLPKINSSILHVRRNSSSSREKSDREILKGTLLCCAQQSHCHNSQENMFGFPRKGQPLPSGKTRVYNSGSRTTLIGIQVTHRDCHDHRKKWRWETQGSTAKSRQSTWTRNVP